MTEPQSCAMKEPEASSKLSPDTKNSSTNWPSLGEQNKLSSELNGMESEGSSEEWENLSSDEMIDDDSNSPKVLDTRQHTDTRRNSLVHRCMSTPELSHLRDEDSYVDCSESVDAQSLATTNSVSDDAVLLSRKKASPVMKKVPSFKDIIMLNAQSRADEEKKKKQIVMQHQQKLRKDAAERRKANRPKLIISPIKRCAKSTGDLRSMVIHEEPEDDGFGGGGGGTIHEDEIMGETDAMEFYSRKTKGSLNRQNGLKIRPDEAKRKEFIIHKKNAQRKAQQARAAGN